MNVNDLLRVAGTVLPLFSMLAIGMLSRKKQLFSEEGISALKFLVVNITLPAVMFQAFASAEYTASSAVIPVTIFAACLAALGLGFALCKMFKITGALTPYLCTGFEAGMLGYALFSLLFPDESVSRFALIDLGQVLFVFTVYKSLIGGGGLKNALKQSARSPVIWAIAAGLLFGASGLYRALSNAGISGLLSGAASFIAAPTSAVILLTIGYDLVPGEIRWRSTLAFVLLRAAVMAAIFCAAALLNKTLLQNAMHTGALALMFILPPPYVLPVFASVDGERANIASALSALTLISLILFAVLTVIFA